MHRQAIQRWMCRVAIGAMMMCLGLAAFYEASAINAMTIHIVTEKDQYIVLTMPPSHLFFPTFNNDSNPRYTISPLLKRMFRTWLPNIHHADTYAVANNENNNSILAWKNEEQRVRILADSKDIVWIATNNGWSRKTTVEHLIHHMWYQNDLTDSRPSVYPRCALVGPSGTLMMKEYGSEIDNHDLVARMNMHPPISSFDHPKNAGLKTDVRFGNGQMVQEQWSSPMFDHMHDSLAASSGVFQLFNFHTAEINALENTWNLRTGRRKGGFGLRPVENSSRGAPVLGAWSIPFRAWVETLLEDHCMHDGKERHPASTGFLAAITLMFTCRELDIYGFGMLDPRFCRYYYSMCNAEKAAQLAESATHGNHPWSCEESFLRHLAKIVPRVHFHAPS